MTPKKILLVDDAKTVLMMERMILNQPDFQLLVAENGHDALELAREQCPDLILLDVIMPDMTGIDVCAELRNQAATKDTPIIMVTTRSEAEYVSKARAAGCTDYVTKPLDGAALLQKVRQLLEASSEVGK